MAESSVSYKCPDCSAPLTFLPGHDKVTCEYCGNEFEIKTIEALFQSQEKRAAREAAAQQAKWDTRKAGSEWSEAESAALHTCICSSCGYRSQYYGNGVLLLWQPYHDSQEFWRNAKTGLHHSLPKDKRGCGSSAQSIL